MKSSGSIEFNKNDDLKIDINRKNNTFAIYHQSTIQLYNMNNFKLYLEETVESEESKAGAQKKGSSKKMDTLGSIQGFI